MGWIFNISSFIAIGLVYLITAIEATGDVTANSMISGKSIGRRGVSETCIRRCVG